MSQLITVKSKELVNNVPQFDKEILIDVDTTIQERGILNIPTSSLKTIGWTDSGNPISIIIDSPVIVDCVITQDSTFFTIPAKKLVWEGLGFTQIQIENNTSDDISVRYEIYN